MKIARGMSRTVFIFSNFVIKLPRIYWGLIFGTMWREMNGGDLMYHLKTYRVKHHNTIPNYLFSGIVENWAEFLFYKRNKSFRLLAPTHFSFFGLLNVQQFCEPLMLRDDDLWSQLVRITDDAVIKDGHAFASSKNFGTYNGEIRMVDYGSKGTREALSECADKIFHNFNFSYRRNQNN